jgi:branched-chain amino acid transport system ATP-binding protein
MLKVEHLNAWYGPAQILFDVSLTVGRGEVVCLMGRNGAGKSTTMKAIMAMLERRQGEITWLGQDISSWPTHRIAASGLGFVPQERRIFTDLTVAENLEVGRQPVRRFHQAEPLPAWTAQRVFDLFPNLARMGHRQASKMSGGEQQMLSVARTLMGNPFLVLLDEPAEGLAPVLVEQMARMIQTLKDQGVSMLLSEQNLHFARMVSDRAYVIEKGVMAYSGSLQDLMDKQLGAAGENQ